VSTTTVRSPYPFTPTGACRKCERQILPDEQVTLVPIQNPEPAGEKYHLVCSVCAAGLLVLSEFFDVQRAAADQLHQEKIAREAEARLEQLHADLDRIRKQKIVQDADESSSELDQAFEAMDRAFKLLETREAELVNAKIAIAAKRDRFMKQDQEWTAQDMAWIAQVNRELSELTPVRRRLVDAAMSTWYAWDNLERPSPGDALSRLTIDTTPLEILAEEGLNTQYGWEVRQSGKYGPNVMQQISKTRIHRKSNKREVAARFMDSEAYKKLSPRDQNVVWMFAKGDASQAEIAELSGMQPSNVSRLIRKACSRG
jgi:hypothetical protein